MELKKKSMQLFSMGTVIYTLKIAGSYPVYKTVPELIFVNTLNNCSKYTLFTGHLSGSVTGGACGS